jgi:hypothetical protein
MESKKKAKISVKNSPRKLSKKISRNHSGKLSSELLPTTSSLVRKLQADRVPTHEIYGKMPISSKQPTRTLTEPDDEVDPSVDDEYQNNVKAAQ